MPAALIWATAVNFTPGLITVLVINFSITDINALLSTSLSKSGPVGPVIQIFATATTSLSWTTAISVLLLATFIPCFANTKMAASRQSWAFAEDGALPNSLWIRKVDVIALVNSQSQSVVAHTGLTGETWSIF